MCLYCNSKCHYHLSLLVRFLFNLLQKHFMIIVSSDCCVIESSNFWLALFCLILMEVIFCLIYWIPDSILLNILCWFANSSSISLYFVVFSYIDATYVVDEISFSRSSLLNFGTSSCRSFSSFFILPIISLNYSWI